MELLYVLYEARLGEFQQLEAYIDRVKKVFKEEDRTYCREWCMRQKSTLETLKEAKAVPEATRISDELIYAFSGMSIALEGAEDFLPPE